MFIYIKYVGWCKSAKKLMHLGPYFPTDHISIEQDWVTLRGIEEININTPRVAKFSNSVKDELTFSVSIHIYLNA